MQLILQFRNSKILYCILYKIFPLPPPPPPPTFITVSPCLSHYITGIAQWLERRVRDWKVAGSNPCRSGGRIFFSRVNFLCWLLFRYPFYPRVTAVARKRTRSFCLKCRWQVTAKHTYTHASHNVNRCYNKTKMRVIKQFKNTHNKNTHKHNKNTHTTKTHVRQDHI